MKKAIQLNQENLPRLTRYTHCPVYDRGKVETGIVHVGIGGFHRSHQAFYTDELLQTKKHNDWGICGVALLDWDSKIYDVLDKQDGLYTLIVKEFDGAWTTRVIGSITEYLFAPKDPGAVIHKMADEKTKIISLTITEGGYNFDEATGKFKLDNPHIQNDLSHPLQPKTIFGYLTQAIKLRRDRGSKGCTILSCDNIEGNGAMTKKMLLEYMKEAQPDLIDWVHQNMSFPNSMVDRITPVTVDEDIQTLKENVEIEDAWPVVCEPFIQWVIEDNFIAGRPQWETVGAQFVEDVVPYEKMKLSLLNAGHSVVGLLGALLGIETIDQAVNDASLRTFLAHFMDIEVTPVLSNLKGVDLRDYKNSLIQRFANKNIKDQVSRICSESSAKIPKFLLPTLREQLKKDGPLERAAFVIATWAIYSLGTDEKGIALSIMDAMKDILYEKAVASKEEVTAFLGIEAIFGNLATSKRFVASYSDAYKKITELGIRKAVDEMNDLTT